MVVSSRSVDNQQPRLPRFQRKNDKDDNEQRIQEILFYVLHLGLLRFEFASFASTTSLGGIDPQELPSEVASRAFFEPSGKEEHA